MDPSLTTVVVVGGNKSAVDRVNACALAGKPVSWIVRPGDSSTGLLLEARENGIHGGAIANARWSSLFAPIIFRAKGFWYRFLHSGRLFLDVGFCSSFKLSATALGDTYEKSENLRKLKLSML